MLIHPKALNAAFRRVRKSLWGADCSGVRDLKHPKRKPLLPRHSRQDLRDLLWNRARSAFRLSQRLRLSARGAAPRAAALARTPGSRTTVSKSRGSAATDV